MELSLAYCAARFAKENVIISIGVKRGVEINEIYARIWEFFAIREPLEIVAEVQPIHVDLIVYFVQRHSAIKNFWTSNAETEAPGFRTLLNHVPEPKCKQPVRAWIWMQTIGDRTCSIPKSKDVNSSVFRVAMASPEILYHRAVLRVESGEGFA